MQFILKPALFLLYLLTLFETTNCNHRLNSFLTFNSNKYDKSYGLKNQKSIVRKLVENVVLDKINFIRGGSSESEDENEDDSNSKSSDDIDNENESNDDSTDNDDDDTNNSEANAASLKSSAALTYLTDMWKTTPPITQIYVGSSIFLTVLSLTFFKNQWPKLLHLEWLPVFTKFQIWRPITAFLYFGPLGLNYLLTIQFVWTYMGQLEKLNYNKPEDFFIMIIFGIVSLLSSYSLLGFSTKFLGHNLSTYLVYIWARLFEGSEVNVMDLFFLKAEILPFFFCLQTFLLEGEFPFADILGIVVGHLYYYLKQRNILQSPALITQWFSNSIVKAKYLKFKDDFE